jgi:hypothetical protein
VSKTETDLQTIASNLNANVANMGYWASDMTMARFGHKDHNTNGGFGFLQTADGGVNMSAPAGSSISFQINNVQKAYMDANGYFYSITPPTSDYTDTVPTTAWVKDVAAPISHASTATTYGRSDATNFGHAMASSATPAMDGTASAGTDNGKFTREGHRHPVDTSRATRAKDSVVALPSGVTMSSVIDGTTYTLTQYGTATLPANVGSIGDRVYFTVTGCSAGPITVNGLQKSGGQGVSGIIAEKCALGWCVC